MKDAIEFLASDREALRVAGVFALTSVVLFVLVKGERRRILRICAGYVTALLLHLGAHGSLALAMPATSKALEFLTLVCQGLALIGLLFVVLFGAVLPALRVRAPQIVRELSFGLACLGFVLYLFSVLRFDMTGIVATSAVVTAVIGFSLQDTLFNVVGGLALQMDGSVKRGDWVLFDKYAGLVKEIRWRHTSIAMRNGNVVVVPNSLVAKSPVAIRGRVDDPSTRERRVIPFHVDYRTPPARVMEMVTEALTRAPLPNVASTPAAHVLFVEYRESWATYAVRYWLTEIAEDEATDSAVRTHVYYALKRCGVPFSIPSHNVFMTPEGKAREELARERSLEARVEALETVSIFRPLTADERRWLAEELIHSPFAPGEAILVQGRTAHHLYIMTKGKATVRLSVEGAPPRDVAVMEAPDVFGEMGMLTGNPRRATVIADTEVECWRLEKETFQKILSVRPQIADEISHVLADREMNLSAASEDLSEEARRRRLSDRHHSIRTQILEFFAIG